MSRSAYVQKARKSLPYDISTIGGAKELEAWKKYWKAREIEWHKEYEKERQAFRQNAISVVNGSKEAALTDTDKAELHHVKRRYALVETPKPNLTIITLKENPNPSKTLLERLEEACAKLWCRAFRSSK